MCAPREVARYLCGMAFGALVIAMAALFGFNVEARASGRSSENAVSNSSQIARARDSGRYSEIGDGKSGRLASRLDSPWTRFGMSWHLGIGFAAGVVNTNWTISPGSLAATGSLAFGVQRVSVVLDASTSSWYLFLVDDYLMGDMLRAMSGIRFAGEKWAIQVMGGYGLAPRPWWPAACVTVSGKVGESKQGSAYDVEARISRLRGSDDFGAVIAQILFVWRDGISFQR